MNSVIIFLRGITPEDFKDVEKQFEEKLMERQFDETFDNNTFEENYDTIPIKFSGLDCWVKHTNLKCWNCDFTFDTCPIFIPLHIKKLSRDTIETDVHGNFCSFACAAREIVDHLDSSLFTNLIRLCNIFNGSSTIKHITPAPRRTIMRKYGGRLSDVEFLESIKKIEQNLQSSSNRDFEKHFIHNISTFHEEHSD